MVQTASPEPMPNSTIFAGLRGFLILLSTSISYHRNLRLSKQIGSDGGVRKRDLLSIGT
jgi:hypothetical protein